jgi:hypothetical protein
MIVENQNVSNAVAIVCTRLVAVLERATYFYLWFGS